MKSWHARHCLSELCETKGGKNSSNCFKIPPTLRTSSLLLSSVNALYLTLPDEFQVLCHTIL